MPTMREVLEHHRRLIAAMPKAEEVAENMRRSADASKRTSKSKDQADSSTRTQRPQENG